MREPIRFVPGGAFAGRFLLWLLLAAPAAGAMPAGTTFGVGDAVQVHSGGAWYEATVLEVGTGAYAGRYKVGYVGWGSGWDEYVAPGRMRRKPAAQPPGSGSTEVSRTGEPSTRTERWSETEASVPGPASGAKQEGSRSQAPRAGDEPQVVRNPASVDPRLAGAWDLWIGTGVSYHTDGVDVVRRIDPGAPVDQLRITAQGTYRWKRNAGRLRELKPWFATEGQRYFEVSDGSQSYLLRHDVAKDQVNLFHTTGGHVASGQRAR